MPAKIDIVIKDGKIALEVSGVEDASCEQLTKALEQALGEVEEVNHKPEYWALLDPVEQFAYEDYE